MKGREGTMSEANRKTLRSYEGHAAAYVAGTASEVSGVTKDWIEAALQDLPATARLVEIGSAFGRDAAYIAARGFQIECTDAAESFVVELQKRGIPARRFDVLTERLEPGYDLLLANAVLHHFERQDLATILGQLGAALQPGGRLAFSLKRGQGEEWSDAKLGAPRFFCYWEPEQLPPLLRAAGFASWRIDTAKTGRVHADWLYVIAQRCPIG